MDKQKIALTIILFCFGIIITTQYHSHVSFSSDLGNLEQEELAVMARELTTQKRLLDSEINDLEKRLNEVADTNASSIVILENLRSDLVSLNKLNGTIEVKGPGVLITIEEEAPIIYTDLVKIVNELWNSGAEAIAVNDNRVTASSYFYQSDLTYQMTIDAVILDPPFVIKALGNPDVLKTGLELPGGIIDEFITYDIKPEITTIPELFIPASDKKIDFSYARAVQ